MSKRATSNDDAPITKRIRIDNRNQTEPLADKCAWAILEQFLTTDMSYEMGEALSCTLSNRYSPDDLEGISRCTIFRTYIRGSAPNDSSLAERRSSSARVPKFVVRASQTTLVTKSLPRSGCREEDDEEESEAGTHDTSPSDSWKVTSMPGSSSAARFATAIDGMTHRFEATQRSSSHDCHAIPSSISDLIPSVGLQDGRMYLLHVQRNVTDYIAAHLRKRKNLTSRYSPKTIAKSLPFCSTSPMKQYVRISDEEREVVERSYNKLPNPAW
ncbi:hypothetical protein DFH29DRAFT_883000, partial [Suillus ampliporus]